MFPWIFYFAITGLGIFLFKIKKWKKKHWQYIFSLLLISIILILYYGSWNFHDNPDPSKITIGNSYTRYWLPIYLGLIPLASYFGIKFFSALFFFLKDNITMVDETGKRMIFSFNFGFPRKSLMVASSLVIAIAIISALSISFVLYGSDEGLIYSAQNQKDARSDLKTLLEKTENNSVIITFYHDKLLFPERKVIIGNLNDANTNNIYSELVSQLPLYYYNFNLSEKDLEYLNTKTLKDAMLQIKLIQRINKSFSLLIKKKKFLLYKTYCTSG